MGNLPHKPLAKLRTFQRDQAQARGEAPLPISVTDNTPQKAAPVAAPKIVVTTTKKAVEETKKEPPIKTAATPLVTPPAFHELQKHATKRIEHIVAESSKPVAPQKTVTVRKMNVPQPTRSFSSEATVISSGRKNEFRLFPAMLASFKAWLGSLGKTNSSPTYTVSTLDRRKELIQKATTRSGASFTTDNDSLKNELAKNREEESHDIHLSWSPKTETVFPLLEEPDRPVALPPKNPVVISYKKKSIPAPQLVEPTIQPDVAPKRVFVPPPPPEKSAWESDVSTAPDSPYAAPAYVPVAQPPVAPIVPATPPPVAPVASPVFRIPESIQPVPATPAPTFVPPPPPPITPPPVSSVPTPSPAAATIPLVPVRFTKPGTSIPNKPNPKTSYLNRGLRQLFRFDTTVASVLTVGSIVSFLLVFLIVKTFVGMITPTTGVSNTPLSLATPLTASGNVIDVAISAPSKEALESALDAQNQPSTGVVEFRILEANGTPVTGSQLWRIFGFSSNPNLSSSITEAHLGYSQAEPILALKVTDAVTVFGALLLWESVMVEELAPVFESPTRPVTSVEDTTIKNSDVRILKNNDETILVYGFIDKNIVVITRSLEAYEATLGDF